MTSTTGIQFIPIDTPGGTKLMPAPPGRKFDKGCTSCWFWLMRRTSEAKDGFPTKRAYAVNMGERHMLAIVLSNCIGMAPPYWEGVAAELCEVKWK